MTSRVPKHGQIETLPEVTAPVATSELSRTRAMSTVTRPEMWGLTVDKYGDITNRMVERANPLEFATDLYGQKGFNAKKYVADYEQDDGSRKSVALTADEFKIFPRSMNLDNPASTITSGVEAGKYSLASREKRDEKVQEATDDAFIRMYAKMSDRSQILASEIVLLNRLQEASTHYWRQRGHTDRLRIEIAQVRDLIIPRMMEVVGKQRGWNADQQALATRSLEYRLFFTMPDKARMAEWRNVMTVLKTWDEHKITAFKDRMGRVEGRVGRSALQTALNN